MSKEQAAKHRAAVASGEYWTCFTCKKSRPASGFSSCCKNCKPCRMAARKEARVELREKGICTTCGKQPAASPGRSTCDKCNQVRLAAKNRSNRRRRASGKCTGCGIPAIEFGVRCETCTLKQKLKSAGGRPEDWDMLGILWDEQGSVCPYTGYQIGLGQAQLDHVMPRSRGGECDVSNFQFTFGGANQMKGDMTEEEFLSLVAAIYRHCVNTGKITEES